MTDPTRKWLDKKQYMRVEPRSGLPQLIRIEPMVTDDGQFIPGKVVVFLDDKKTIVDREDAEEFIAESNCILMEGRGHQKVNG
jgi:hypothetical protein